MPPPFHVTPFDTSVAVAFGDRFLHRLRTRYWIHKLISRSLIATSITFFLSASLAGAETADYLSEPIDEKAREPYRDLLKAKLVTSAGNYGVVTFMPASVGEWAVAADSIRQARQKRREYRLTLSSAVENLYQAKLNAEQKAAEVPVKRTSVKIDRNLALAIQRAWRAILSKDPPDPARELQSIALDGFSADFSVRMPDGKRITRRAYSSKAPPASEIVNLGYDLREYCLSPSAERKRKRRVLMEKLESRFATTFAWSSGVETPPSAAPVSQDDILQITRVISAVTNKPISLIMEVSEDNYVPGAIVTGNAYTLDTNTGKETPRYTRTDLVLVYTRPSSEHSPTAVYTVRKVSGSWKVESKVNWDPGK